MCRSGRRGSNSRPLAWKANALPTELLPQIVFLWAKMDSNHRRYKPADLQSAPFGHSGIRPCLKSLSRFDNAKLRKKFGLCQIKIEFFYKKGGRILDIGFFLLIYQIFMVVFMLGAEAGDQWHPPQQPDFESSLPQPPSPQ